MNVVSHCSYNSKSYDLDVGPCAYTCVTISLKCVSVTGLLPIVIVQITYYAIVFGNK